MILKVYNYFHAKYNFHINIFFFLRRMGLGPSPFRSDQMVAVSPQTLWAQALLKYR